MNEEGMLIRNIVDAIRKRWQLIVGMVLISTIIATVYSFFIVKPKYSASAKLFIGKETNVDSNSNDIQMYQQLIKTYSNVIMTNDLIDKSLQKADIDLPSNKVLATLSAIPVANTQILQIKYTGEDKEMCKDVVDAITEEFVSYSTELVSNANVSIIEKARMPQAPVSPNKKMNILAAFFVGLLLGGGLAITAEFMDSTIKDKESLEKITDLPVIGIIPNIDKVK